MNPQVKGTKHWAVSQWCWAIGLLLILPREVWPLSITVIFANGLLVIGSLFFLRGMSLYQGVKPMPVYADILITLALVIVFCYYTYYQPSLNTRVALISTFSALIMLRGLSILLPTILTSKGTGVVVGLGLAFHALFFLSRILVSYHQDNSLGVLQGGGGAVWIMAEAAVFIFWCTISYFMLTNIVLQRNLKSLANKDPLTDLLNRRAVFEQSQILINEGGGNCFSILVLDLDHFKNINDVHGHGVGDQVLQRFAGVVKAELRKEDIFGRTGGEEFIISLPNTSLDQASIIANRLCDIVRNTLVLTENAQIRFSVSIGVSSTFTANKLELRQLINQADKAMYRAKHNGRDRVEINDEVLKDGLLQSL